MSIRCLALLATVQLVTHGVRAEDVKAEAAPPEITAADWPSYNRDVLGWRYNSQESALAPSRVDDIVLKWRFPPRGSKLKVGAIHVTPTVVNGYSYFGTASSPAFYKLAPDGSLVWMYNLGEDVAVVPKSADLSDLAANKITDDRVILCSALVTDDGVFFGDSYGVFYALERSTGNLRWKVDTRREGFPGHHPINVFMCSAILADGKVVVGGGGYEHPHPRDPNYPCCTGRGFVVAFDPGDGKVVWKYEVGEKPQEFDPPLVVEDANGKHVFKYGPSTSSVWSVPSYDASSGMVFFGTDVHNSPRRPTPDDPSLSTKYSAAIISLDVKTGEEQWVSQINAGDIYNHTMSGYDPKTRRYKDCSIGDTPKIYDIDVDGRTARVVGVGCKNGGFYVYRAKDGKLLAKTPVYEGEPKFPLDPKPDPRMIALPSPIGGIQTGCASDGRRIYTNGIDYLRLNTKNRKAPEGGRVVCLDTTTQTEHWRHERPRIRAGAFSSGDPVASGIALGGGLACFTTTVSEKLVILEASSGKQLREIDIGTVWSGPSISRGRIFVGTGSILFFKKRRTGELLSFGLRGEDEMDRMGKGNE